MLYIISNVTDQVRRTYQWLRGNGKYLLSLTKCGIGECLRKNKPISLNAT